MLEEDSQIKSTTSGSQPKKSVGTKFYNMKKCIYR